MIFSYTEVLGFAGYKTTLDKVDTPLNIIAELVGMRILIVPLSFGAMIGSFAAVSACVNSSARILYSMSRGGILPPVVGSAPVSYTHLDVYKRQHLIRRRDWRWVPTTT